jgi:hypothetical protein
MSNDAEDTYDGRQRWILSPADREYLAGDGVSALR